MALLAAYSFDEASGTILDASGNGRNVTFGGSLTRVTGHTNTGLSQSTTAGDSAGPALTGMQTAAYTIMGWVFRSSNSLDGWLMEFKQSGSGDRGLLFLSGAVQSRCKNVAGTVFTAAVTQPTAGTAYHFACTNDGSTLKLFINGTQVASTAFSGGVRTNSTSSSLFDALGSDTWLDDARYYDTALDAATITALMGSPVTGGTVVGAAAETDTAQPVTRARAAAVGVPAETDAAQPATRVRLVVVGTAVEADTPQPVARARATSLGTASESDTAQAATRLGPALGIALETDTAQPLGRARLTVVGTAVEVDAAQPLATGHVVAVAAATESDSALPTTRLRALTAAPAAETDTARPVTAARLTLVGAALEEDAAIVVRNPNAVIRDLDLAATLEPGRFITTVEPARFTSVVERDRFRTEIIAS